MSNIFNAIRYRLISLLAGGDAVGVNLTIVDGGLVINAAQKGYFSDVVIENAPDAFTCITDKDN